MSLNSLNMTEVIPWVSKLLSSAFPNMFMLTLSCCCISSNFFKIFFCSAFRILVQVRFQLLPLASSLAIQQ